MPKKDKKLAKSYILFPNVDDQRIEQKDASLFFLLATFSITGSFSSIINKNNVSTSPILSNTKLNRIIPKGPPIYNFISL